MSHKILAVVALALLGTAAVYHLRHSHAEHHSHNSHTDATLHTVEKDGENHYYPNYVIMFHSYKLRNNLKFGAAEDSKRLGIFISNAKIVEAHNAKNDSSYTLGITDLAHLTLEEFSALKLGYKGISTNAARGEEIIEDVDAAEVDWVKKGAVTPVKNQGQCGSCWSFSTTGSLEGLNFIKNHKLVSFSEQDLVDCSGSYGNQGCNGGLMDQAFNYVEAHGIATEADYPYTAADGTCNNNVKREFKIKGHKDVEANNNKALVKAIAQQPVSVAIEADTSDFQLYAKGVITGSACGTQLDHGVLAVGYGKLGNKAYIKVKNSWGPSWGLNGYVLIGQATGAGVCGINSDPSYPTL